MKKQTWKKQQRLGISLLLAAVLVIGMAIYTGKGQQAPSQTEGTTTETELPLANDASDVDPKQAAKKMNLQIQMEPETKKRVPDLQELKEELTDYLIQEDFYTDVTRAISTNVVTDDYNQQIRIFSFTLNNPDQTPLDAVYDRQTGTYTFTYY